MPYEYTADAFAKAFERLYKTYASEAYPVNDPRAVLLGGQSGSGKTTIHRIEKEHDPNVVIINGDEFRADHPQFKRICTETGDDFVMYTQSFANAMSNALIERLSDEGYNLVIEGTLRTTDVPLASYDLLSDKGYSVELAVMATPVELSWQGTIDRYNQMLAAGIPARATTRENHDNIVNHIVSNLHELYNMRIFDNIVMYDRTKRCLYDMKKTPNVDPSKILDMKLHSRTKAEREMRNER